MTYAESVRFLYSLGNEVETAKLGLERIRRLLSALGDPHKATRFIHVAGTNGKGSTSAMIESGLRQAGQRTGLYTSPHLVEPTERIRVQGEPVSEGAFAWAFDLVHGQAVSLLRDGRLDFHPTYFESVTAMAFVLFREAGLDWVVLEVGLGGRLDATNVVTPELCVITPIDFDHQAFLGHSLRAIATEKAGILKPGVPAIIAPQHPEAANVIREAAQGPLIFSEDWPITGVESTASGSRFELRGWTITCPLAGEHQLENARTAASALLTLAFSPAGIASTVWPGRLERVWDRPEIILDGAHNPAGALALQRYIRRFFSGREIWLVYGVMRDKAVQEMTALLFPGASRIILTAPANARALPVEQIPSRDATLTHSVREAVGIALTAPPHAAVFVTGSLFVVGEARQVLKPVLQSQ